MTMKKQTFFFLQPVCFPFCFLLKFLRVRVKSYQNSVVFKSSPYLQRSVKSMRLLFIVLLSVAALLGGVPAGFAATVRFAPLPMENKETVLSRFRPLTEFLARRLHVAVDYVYAEDYAELLENFRQSKVDIAYLGPLPYVELRDSYAEAEPLVFFKESSQAVTYTCALVTFPGNDFDIRHGRYQKIALTQPLSTCGYLSTNGLLRKNNNSLEDNHYRYVGKHDEVALSVIRGEFAAGGLKTAVARKYAHLGLFVLMETPPLPAFALIVNTRTMSPDLIAGIKGVLLELDLTQGAQGQKKPWNDVIGNGVVEAHDRDYQVIRDLLGSTPIQQEGNF
jgi:phosphonate transport system substrate-binding protein